MMRASPVKVLSFPLSLILSAAVPALAQQEAGTPDGRVRVRADGGADPGTGEGHGRLSGDLGAFGFDNTIEGSDSGFRITNLPFNRAQGTNGAEYEELFGPRVANTTIGTGAITEGIDVYGRLTVLDYPGPGLYDHVNFSTITRGVRNQGAPVNGGSFGGIVVNGKASWIHPEHGWKALGQTYASEDSQTVVTPLCNDALDVEVEITDVVHPQKDLVARNFAFWRNDHADCDGRRGSPLQPASFVHFGNWNPTTSRLPRAPSIFDTALDNLSDFATVFSSDRRQVLLHFRPYKVDPAALSQLATAQPGVETASAAVSGSFGPGIYVAVGTRKSTDLSWQAGHDAVGLVQAEAGPLADAYYDLLDDGELSGSPAAFGKTTGAIGDVPPDADGTYTVYIGAGESSTEAIGLVEEGRALGFSGIREASEDDWEAWISRARLPDTDDAGTVEVAKRALMLIRTAQDRRTGAILANVTTQTPYRQDWVRDGAFFNYALLLAGYPEMVEKHNEFYKRVYRIGGTWDTLYYPDGAEAGFIFPFEIDSQAFALWALWLPYEFWEQCDGQVPGTGDECGLDEDYLARAYPAIASTANVLRECQDPTTGMQCFAPEDDNPEPTRGAQGASTVYLGLRRAADAANVLGETDPGWDARADELRQATFDTICDEGSGCGGSGRGAIYTVWPSRLLDAEDTSCFDPSKTPPACTTIADVTQEQNQKFIGKIHRWSTFQEPERDGFFQYPMEPLFALGTSWDGSDPDGFCPQGKQDCLQDWLDWLVHDVSEPGVLHYAERIYRCAGEAPFCDDGFHAGREYLHTVGFPHIWSGTELYITAAFVHGVTNCPAGVTKVGEATCAPSP